MDRGDAPTAGVILVTMLSVREFAARFCVAPKTVRDWIRRDLVKAKRDLATGRLYIPPEQVERRLADMADREPGTCPPALIRSPPEPEPEDEPQEDDDMPTKVNVKKASKTTKAAGGSRPSSSDEPSEPPTAPAQPAEQPEDPEPVQDKKEVKKDDDEDWLHW